MNDTDDAREMLAGTARTFAQRQLSPGALRVEADGAGFDAALWDEITELGLPALLIAEDDGGLGLGLADLAAMLTELGQPLMRLPVVPHALGALVVMQSDNAALRSRLLPEIAAGAIHPLAWAEGYAGLPPARFATRAQRTGDGYRIDGTKTMVVPAAGWSGLIVAARGDDGQTALFWLPADAAGLSLVTLRTADGGLAAEITLTGVDIPADHLLAVGRAPLDRALAMATLASCAEMIGLIRGALAMTVEYLSTRRQFGHAIGSFQALQHRAADLYLHQILSESSLETALAEAASADTATLLQAASRTKARCSAAALAVTKEAIQMHGGIGFTHEHDIGLYLKRALTLQAWLGNTAEHRARFAALTQGKAA